jgi:23S rRNA A2030 N6-methylase RlmJ
MRYDHHNKAGNQGDCVKHPALIAALDTVLVRNPGDYGPFDYLDIFAGHAWHPLLDQGRVPGVQKEGEWTAGIGVLHHQLWEGQNLNEHVRLWRDWYLPRRPALLSGWYPGSSIIAGDVCRKHKRAIRMTLFDKSDEVQVDLRRFFQPVQPTELTGDDWCVIGRSLNPTEVKDDAIREPDFVFIDPPGWSDKDPSYPEWPKVYGHILKPRKNRPTLMWIPTAGTDGAFKRKPHKKIKEAADLGYEWCAVRWKLAGANSACALVYNCAGSEIRKAVECVAAIPDFSTLPVGERVNH